MKPTKRWLDGAADLVGLRLVLWLVVAAAFVPGALADPYTFLIDHDDHYFFMYDDVTRRAIVDYGQFPDWNPWYCGGVPAMGNPQGTPLSPDFILRLLFGVGPGRRITILLFLVLGMEGAFRLARDWDASPIGAAAAAAAWATSGWFAQAIHNGWINHLGFLLIAWIVVAFQRGLRSRGWAVAGGFFLAWALGMGGTYSVPHAALVLLVMWVVETLRLVWKPRSEHALHWTAPSVALAILLGSCFLLGAVKWLPVLDVIWRHPRVWYPNESIPPTIFFDRMLHWQGSPEFTAWVFPLVGVLGVALADKRAGVAIAIASVFFALALGDHGGWTPFALLRRLPGYGQLRGSERFAAEGALFLSLSAARALTVVEDWFARATDRLVGVRLLGGVMGATVATGLGIASVRTMLARDFVRAAEYSMAPALRRDAPFRQSYGNRWDVQVFAPVSLGSLQCFEEIPFPQSSKLRGDLAAEEYPLDPDVATVVRKTWSPNVLVLGVRATAPTTVYVNQNWNRGWRTNVGTVRDDDGLLAIDVPAGEYDLRLTHRDTLVVLGGTISCLAYLGLFAWIAAAIRRYAQRRGPDSSSVASAASPSSPS